MDGHDASLGCYLRTLRRESGLTLRQLAARCGVSNPCLSQLEQDQVKRPSPRTLWALADHYGVDWLELMRRAGHPVPPATDGAPRQTVTFRGAERLTPEERREIEAIIAHTLEQREGAGRQRAPERVTAPV